MAEKIEAAHRVPSFRECAEAYIAAHAAEWTNAKRVGQWAATLATYAYPIFGDLPVSAVDTGLVMRALEPHWATKRESMSRVRGRIESILGWATVHGYREGDSPDRWRGHLANLLARPAKKVQGEHYNALPYAALPAFMVELRAKDGMPARAHFASPAARRRPERNSSRCSGLRRGTSLGTTIGVIARNLATVARASSSRPYGRNRQRDGDTVPGRLDPLELQRGGLAAPHRSAD